MEDIIPFLIVALISLIGAASRKKKRKQYTDDFSEKKSESGKDDFLSWMERLSVDDEEPAIPYQPQAVVPEANEFEEVEEEKKEVSATQYEHHPYEHYSGFITPEEKKELVEKEAPLTSKMERKEKEDVIKLTEIGKKRKKVDFNLKKAVIFSEVLNRKYS